MYTAPAGPAQVLVVGKKQMCGPVVRMGATPHSWDFLVLTGNSGYRSYNRLVFFVRVIVNRIPIYKISMPRVFAASGAGLSVTARSISARAPLRSIKPKFRPCVGTVKAASASATGNATMLDSAVLDRVRGALWGELCCC